jgi:hypothetical protein
MIQRTSSRSNIGIRPGLSVSASHFRNRACFAQCILSRTSSGLRTHKGLLEVAPGATVVEATTSKGMKYDVSLPILFP